MTLSAAVMGGGVAELLHLLNGQTEEDERWWGLFSPTYKLDSYRTLAAGQTAAPRTASMFVKLNSGFLTLNLLNQYAAAGFTPFLTIEPWMWQSKPGTMIPELNLTEQLAGTYDYAYKKIANILRLYDKPVYIRLAHEMNGFWYPWAANVNGNSVAQYRDYWKHVRELFQDVAATWVFAPAAVQTVRKTGPAIKYLYPGDDYVDIVGTTGYGHEVDAAATYTRTFAQLADITDKPFLIPEMGAVVGTNRAGTTTPVWIRSFASYLHANPRIQGFVYFDIGTAQNATGDYRLTGPTTIRALNQLIDFVPVTGNSSYVGDLAPKTSSAQ